jgi:uncharacterized repeat protein (TIGR01451 family)
MLAPSAENNFAIASPMAGTYSVVETANPAYTTVATCDNGSPANAIVLKAGQIVTCTFTNTLVAKPHLAITKVASEASYSAVGDIINYTIVPTNDGNVTIPSVTVSDPLVSGLNCTPANGSALLPGESMTCVATHSVTQSDLDAGHFANTSCVDDGELGAPQACADEDVPGIQMPILSLEKTGAFDAGMDGYANPGELISYVFTVSNIGNIELHNVSVTDPLISPIKCTDTTIPVGGSVTCAGSYVVTQVDIDTGFVYNMAVADSDESPPDEDDHNQPLPQNPMIDVEKLVSVDGGASFVDADMEPFPSVSEGAYVEFKFVVKNVGNVTLSVITLMDTDFDLSNCAITSPLAPNEEFECSLPVMMAVPGAHANTATTSGEGPQAQPVADSDDANVMVTDMLPEISLTKTAVPSSVPETGGNVVFTFLVKNIGVEDVTLTSLSDTVFGDLNGQGDCVTGAFIPVGGSYSCSITKLLASDSLTAHYNLVTAVGTDNDGSTDTATDDETVTFDDILPDIMITKSAMPTSVPETGGDVEFTIVVTNNSLEKTTVDSLVDSDFDLAAHCPDAVGTALAYGESYTCIFTEWVSGDYSGMAHENTATVVASDNDGNTDTAFDDATVTYTDVLPDISVTKTANPTYIIAPSGDVTFNFVVKNNGLEAATITALSDDKFGTLTDDADCKIDTVLAAGGSCSFSATFTVSGAGGTSHVNVFTATASDNDGNSDTASDDATVEILATTSKIAPTATTCEQYRDGTALDYTELFYLVSKGKIGSVSPGVIFYYSTITAPAANFTLGFSQSNDLAWKAMAVKQVVLWDSNCVKVQSATVTMNKSNGSATISVTGATPGATYYLSVKPDPGSLTGIPVKVPYPTANYTFSTSMNGSIIATSPDSIAIRPKKIAMLKSEALSAIALYMPDIRQ